MKSRIPAESLALSLQRLLGADIGFGVKAPQHDRELISAASFNALLMLALDEWEHGLVLIDQECRLLHCNHAARRELAAEHALQLESGVLTVRYADDEEALSEALEAAHRRGLRRLLTLGKGRARTDISIVPLPGFASGTGAGATLIVFAKGQFCSVLAVQGYARLHKLSRGEEQVLLGLCEGRSPVELAAAHGVAISTLRTQIASIRKKTATASVADLIQRVAVLPPIVGALRSSAVPTRMSDRAKSTFGGTGAEENQ